MKPVTNKKILATVNAFVDKMDGRFDEVLAVLNDHSKRFDDHSNRMDGIVTVLNDHSKRFDDHSNRMDETLSAMNDFASKVEERFDGVDKRLESLDQRVGHVENQMVTKDYLDDKLADKHGRAVVMIRATDKKVDALVGKLRKEKSLSMSSTHAILKIKPLARA